MPLTDEIQLGYALEAFAFGHNKPVGWPTKKLLYFQSAGITSMSDLLTGCKDNTVNLDLELFGIPPEERLSESTIQYLESFLPGPVGYRTFRLAQRAAEKVKRGSADTEYVHRPESGKTGREQFLMPVDDDWTIHVDCAGFVRNCLKHCTKNSWQMMLSDRDFMRAKDFFGFFQTISYSVMDKEEMPDTDLRMKWRIVNDLRLVIPGDIIVYRPRGNAAGGAAFTENDRKDLPHLLKATKMAQIWMEEIRSDPLRHTRNVARDPTLKPWVKAVQTKLQAVGILTVKDLKANLNSINDLLQKHDFIPLKQDTLSLMKECANSTALNTGHIVFCAGPAVHKGDNQYRVPVVHSTKYGKVDVNGEVTRGVQEHYRRFTMVQGEDGKVTWIRAMKRVKPKEEEEEDVVEEDDEVEDDPKDDMEEDEDNQTDGLVVEEQPEEVIEEDTGPLQAEVMAVRMCF